MIGARFKRPTSVLAHRPGFTLVEILVSIVITGIIASMLTVALRGANRQANQQRATSTVDRLNMLTLQIYEEETERMAPAPPTDFSAEQRALISLMWKRDWLRCALPDRREDVGQWPVPIPRDSTGTGPPPAIAYLEDITVPALNSGISPLGLCAAKIFRNQQYIARSIAAATGISVTTFGQLVDGITTNGEWTAEHQSAECLYLILATSIVNGEPAIDSLNTREIGDTDEDGMPEVLDAWGRPLGFMRWPCGYYLPLLWEKNSTGPTLPTPLQLANHKMQLGKDSIDILYTDPRYADTGTANHQANDPFPMLPMIVSAGNDGVFDLYGLDNDPALTTNSPPVIDYTQRSWPLPPAATRVMVGFPVQPVYDNSFIDPYLGGNTVDTMLGATVDTNEDDEDNTGDNIYTAVSFR